MLKKFLIVTSIAVSLLIVALFLWALYMASPTSAKHISKYEHPRAALMIIDIQEALTGSLSAPPYPYKNSAALIAAINTAIHRADSMHMPVVIVDQEFGGLLGTLWSKMFLGGRLMRGAPGAKTDARVVTPMATTFPKPKGDAFANPDLDRYLRINRIDELYVTGVDAEFCVMLTARGAVNRGYKTTIIESGIGLMNEKNREKVLQKYRKNGIAMIDSLY